MNFCDEVNKKTAKEISNKPWGNYKILYSDDNTKVKLITVNPHSRLSYQTHKHRKEVWTIVKGSLTIILDGATILSGVGQSIQIPLGSAHRAWNQSDSEVQFIEVQTGAYFGEDDIIRLEDDYNRIPNK